ncbi:MAG: hypothetical protein IPI44_08710 [Sulfuritalea sp.]|nr:hypothetical protein [Sulfuritalea sp.]
MVAVFLTAPSTSSGAEPFHCPDSRIVVLAETSIDQQRVCASVASSKLVLETLGLEPIGDGAITIDLLHALREGNGSHAIGQCHYRSKRIEMLTYDAAVAASMKYPAAFGVPMSRGLWDSYVVHEFAHATAQVQFAPGVPTFTASEYIAAVAQMTALSPVVREQILANYGDTTGFELEAEITELFYCMDPPKFAVMAYRHCLKPENGARFVGRLLRHGLPN